MNKSFKCDFTAINKKLIFYSRYLISTLTVPNYLRKYSNKKNNNITGYKTINTITKAFADKV